MLQAHRPQDAPPTSARPAPATSTSRASRRSRRRCVNAAKAVAQARVHRRAADSRICAPARCSTIRRRPSRRTCSRRITASTRRSPRDRSTRSGSSTRVACNSNAAPPGYVHADRRRRRCSPAATTGTGRSCASTCRRRRARCSRHGARSRGPGSGHGVGHPPSAGRSRRSSAQGTSPGYQYFSDGSSFVQARWTQGTTEGRIERRAAVDVPRRRRASTRCAAACSAARRRASNPAGLDYYSRVDNMLPLMRQYLTPNAANPAGTVVAVEFYNRALEHYFISTDAGRDQRARHRRLTSGGSARAPRSSRTTSPSARHQSRVPLLSQPGVGDSHFYSGEPERMRGRPRRAHPVDWIYESPNVFYIALPESGHRRMPCGDLAAVAVLQHGRRPITATRRT